MIGSTARVNSVDANTTRPTILRMGGMDFAPHHEAGGIPRF
jgi:hypothetical protein